MIFFAIILVILQSLWWFLILRKKPKNKDNQNNQHQHCILFASQTGKAEAIAKATALQLKDYHKTWQLMSMNEWCKHYSVTESESLTLLFIVSTHGEGDSPDNARLFWHLLQKTLSKKITSLTHVNYAILGLGSEKYSSFCGFAYDLNHTLSQHKAKPLFNLTTLADEAPEQQSIWHEKLSTHFNTNTLTAPYLLKSPPVQSIQYKLINRNKENPNSPNMALYWLTFSPTSHSELSWQAGDIAIINMPYKHAFIERHYTIANHPNKETNTLSLLVRQLKTETGLLGKGSGYLTSTLSIGQSVTLRIQKNPHFYLPDLPCPIIFIGTGSGLAGLLALMDQSQKQWGNSVSHWVIYGERHPELDRPCDATLKALKADKVIRKIDYCFSRDKSETHYHYVQDALNGQKHTLSQWIKNEGAMIYVCGSKTHLKNSLLNTLSEILGKDKLESLQKKHCIRMDVY